jgi:hypothetical protein
MYDTMKAPILLSMLLLSAPAHAQKAQSEILFTNRVDTITNTLGKVFRDVTVRRATVDYMVYESGPSGAGMIPLYTLSPETVSRFGIDTNWITLSRDRADKNANAWKLHDQAVRDAAAAKRQADVLAAQAEAERQRQAAEKAKELEKQQAQQATNTVQQEQTPPINQPGVMVRPRRKY